MFHAFMVSGGFNWNLWGFVGAFWGKGLFLGRFGFVLGFFVGLLMLLYADVFFSLFGVWGFFGCHKTA